MVFGWGKKKQNEEKTETLVYTEKNIKFDQIKPILDNLKELRTKTILSEVKSFRKKIETQLKDILKITKDLERDDLNVDDIDKHLEILVVRGKKQVIEIIKKEASEKLPEIKSYEDVVTLNDSTKQILKRIGDVLGRQSRVIHIFAKKYAAKLKVHLSLMNSDRDEIQSLVDNYSRMNDDIDFIFRKINSYEQSKKGLLDNEDRIAASKKNIEDILKKIDKTKQEIIDFKSKKEYSQFLETKKKIDSIDAQQQNIKNSIDMQFTKISRPLGRYEYSSSLDKPEKILLENLNSNPFNAISLENKDTIIKILSAVRKGVQSGSISVKDSTKALASIDETIEKLDDFIIQIKVHNESKQSLTKELDVVNIHDLEQKDQEVERLSQEKDVLESKIKKLENELDETKKQLPRIIVDIESKLKKVTSTKYQISE